MHRAGTRFTAYFPILLVLAVAAAARLYNLHAPLIGARGWRQADTMAMAINFHENGYRLLYPQVDWGGETPGYVESEFPIYSYLSALLFGLFGVSEPSARLLSIALSLLAILFFYLLVKDHADEKTAVWASLFLAILPLDVYLGRMIMPESLMMLSLILGVYLFSRWLSREKWADFVLSAVFISLACLIKIPSLYIGLPLLYMAWLKFGNRVFFRWDLWGFGLVVIGATAAWYYHAHQIYLQNGLTFRIWEYGTDKWGNWDLVLTAAFWSRIWIDHLGAMFFAGFGYPIFAAGLFMKRKTDRERIFDFWIAGVLVYFIVVGKGNFVHDYYQLPFTIPAAVYMGKVFGRYFDRDKPLIYASLLLTLAAMCITAAYNYNRIYMLSEDPQASEKYELAQYILQNTDANSLIIVLDNGDPTVLYLSNRKGWHAFSGPQMLEDLELDDKIAKGARYVAGRRDFCMSESQCQAFETLLEDHEMVFRNRKYFIAKLSE